MATKSIYRKRNRLPAGAYIQPGVFFFTTCTAGRRQVFANHAITSVVESRLRKEASDAGAELYAYCFMPDHLHILIAWHGDGDVRRVLARFKQVTGFSVRRLFGVEPWQRGFHDHVLRRDDDIERVAEYILNNPVRAGLCEQWQEYPYAWSRWHNET